MIQLRNVVVDLILRCLGVLSKHGVLSTDQVDVLLQILRKITYLELQEIKMPVIKRGHPNKY